ncbi:MAG: DUF1801 domain-containing protein [Bacteroidetes bacterium]|nr:DUF1801 domain-containing protein [Bacteroidota bacterium]
MAEQKTKPSDKSVIDFINTFADTEQKKQDSFKLIELMQKVSGEPAKMWGASIIGFGWYHYKYASGHEGDAAIIGFSPRKAAISLYVFSGLKEHEYLLKDLGKFKMGKVCIYIKKLSDINEKALINLFKESIKYIAEHHECGCHAARGK